MKPGIHELSYPEYDADPAPEPSMRAGHAKLILTRSPRHAWEAHPKLNSKCTLTHSIVFDLGIAAHALLVGGESRLVVIDEKDYRKNDAKAQRDYAYSQGNTPLLIAHHQRVKDMAEAAREQLVKRRLSKVFTDKGLAERSFIYQDQGIWCRTRPDWHDVGFITDYKTTACAHPSAWQSIAFNTGADIQAEMQCRAVRLHYQLDEVSFRWIVQENKPPYQLCVISLEPAAWSLAQMKVDEACKRWRDCLDSKLWPGYPERTCFIEQPAWHEAQVMSEIGE